MNDDLIRRGDAIDEISHIIPYRRYKNGKFNLLYSKHEVIKTIKAIPAIKPKQGKWIQLNTESEWWGYKCSQCKYGTFEHSNYCPNCGTKMKGENNGRKI